MSRKSFRNIVILTVFSIAMGFMESIIVVYLRTIFYPQGFAFPLSTFVSSYFLNVELLREITTIVMLVCIGLIAGRNIGEKIAYFFYSFGVWDIFYYIGLKIMLDWPESLLTWDILFLIPIPWVAPVLAPVICSLTMISIAVGAIYIQEKYDVILKANISEFLLVFSGILIIFISFIYDYLKLISDKGFLGQLNTLMTNPDFLETVSRYVPEKYKWWMLFIGEILVFVVFLRISYRYKKISNSSQ